ncbi:hypothetical protein PWT90_00325 [Aphanocladium album]|nr:hypothetical protein PWT90_00325 [Aphanocladium album]
MSSPSPPQAPPLLTYSPESLISRTNETLAQNKETVDNVVKDISVDNAEFANVLLPLTHARSAMFLEMNGIGFLGSVSTDSKLRDASDAAEKKFSDHLIELSMREDVFRLVEAVYKKQKSDPALDAESRYLLEREYRGFTRMGLGLPPTERERFQQIKKRLPELYIAFSKNLKENDDGIWFKPEELSGLPSDVTENFERGEQGSENEGKLRLTFGYPEVQAAQKYCKIAETRKKVFLANENKSKQNIQLIEEAVALRDEAARMLGYANHATFVLEDRMAQTPKTVNDFLDDLRTKLASGAKEELENLKKLKRDDPECVDADRFYIWDYAHYNTKMLERDFQLDQNLVSEYFPLQACIDGMLNIFEELFGLIFVKIEGKDRDVISESGNGDDIVWHPDVQLFSVWEDAGEGKASDFVGYLYMDLHPRQGKFGHAANFTLQQGSAKADGSGRRYPATALVCNFSKPTEQKPSLLKHNEMKTLFHELGHGIHNLVSKTTYGRFHGTNTLQDFVEAPSQMLENWCWQPLQLKALSKHWSYLSADYEKAYLDAASDINAVRPEEKIPDTMIDSLVRTRYVNEALFSLRSVHFSMFDMVIHQPKSHEEACNMDISKIYNKLRHDLCMLDDLGDADGYHWANGAGNLNHVMGGYDAALYGYLWSEVYAADMFDTVFKKDPMSKEAGRWYRDTVLKYGGSREPMDMLKDFLGREPSTQAFYKALGIVGA